MSLTGIGARRDGQVQTRVARSPASGSLWLVALGALAVLLASLAFRMGLLSASPEFDELYHLLAARSLLDSGQLAIADGEYTRSALYTRIVALLFGLTGQESLSVGRWVSVLPGLLLPVALFLWLRACAGWLAAGVAAGFAILWPQGIIEAQLLRFYSAHVALFFLGAICVYGAVDRQGRDRWALAALAVLFLALAWALQVTTAIGIAGIGLWLAGVIVLRLPVSAQGRWLAVAGLALAGVLAVIAAQMTGILQKAIEIYRFTPGHAEEVRDYVAFYHNALRKDYETFWPLFPAAVLLAASVKPRLAWFCTALFATGVVVHSFGGMKSGRYLSYVIPFFFALWGVALSALVPMALRALRDWTGSRRAALALMIACAGFAVVSNGFVIRSAKLALGKGYISRGDWRPAAALIGDWADAPFVMTTHELHMLAYVGEYDLLLSYSRATEMPGQGDYAIDKRTGRPVISTPEGLAGLLACKRAGLMVSIPVWWESQGETRAMDQAFEDAGLAVERRQEGEMLVLRWSDPEGRAPDCAAVPEGLR